MITKSQKEIISSLTTEFEKMNIKPSIGGGLIDIGSILSQHEADKKRVNEIKLNNETFKGMQLDIVEEWVGRLNKDLVQLGLKAMHNTSYIKITALDGHVCYTKEVTIDVVLTTMDERIGNGSERIYNGIEYRFLKRNFETMEEVFNFRDGYSDSLQGQIKRLYNELNVLSS